MRKKTKIDQQFEAIDAMEFILMGFQGHEAELMAQAKNDLLDMYRDLAHTLRFNVEETKAHVASVIANQKQDIDAQADIRRLWDELKLQQVPERDRSKPISTRLRLSRRTVQQHINNLGLRKK